MTTPINRGAILALAFSVVLSAAGAAAQGSVEGDRAALEALYHATDGPNWDRSTNWLTDAPLGDWDGVWTLGDGRVFALGLTGNDMSGPIPAELGQLTRLVDLILYENDLSGPIPAELGQLDSLESLSLYHNDLSGPIPAELGQLDSLLLLSLWANDLSGPIPAELGQLDSLQELYIDTDTGLCLPADFPADSPFARLARELGVPDCAAVPVLPWPAIFTLGAGLLTAGLVRLPRRRNPGSGSGLSGH